MSIIEIFSILGFLITIIILVIVIFIALKQKNNSNGSSYSAIVDYIKIRFEEQNKLFNQINQIILNAISNNNDSVLNNIANSTTLQHNQLTDIMNRLNSLLNATSEQMKNATNVLESGLVRLQSDNEKKLEQMRQTVDEKLNVSLERRLTQSFNVINERLQSVYEGLGEMKQLANGVGDLKKVLTNVKTRGVWGEVQLGNLLEQMLTKEQFASQVEIKANSSERVDFVVCLPGKDDKNIYLPIDAKFPIEDYQRLCDASERGDVAEIEISLKALERRVKDEAKKIKEKYIDVPNTTDFAVLYLSLEGLYAEVLRRPGLAECLQQDYKIVVCGPTTLSALLNSLQLGFKTLTIEKRSSEIWSLLGVFKQEFGKFVDLLAKTQKKLAEASNTIEFATKKSKTIQNKLKNVSTIEAKEAGIISFEDELANEDKEDANDGEE